MNYSNVVTPDGFDFKIQTFDSIHDLTDYLSKATPSAIFRHGDCSSQMQTSDYGWYGTKNYQEAQDLLTGGWLPEAAVLAKKIPVSSVMGQTIKKTANYSVVGFQASVPRYLQGLPTNMINYRNTPQKQKIVVLNRCITFNASWSSAKIEAEGIKALQVIQALEGNGFRVKLNIIAINGIKGRNGWNKSNSDVAVAKICVKKPEEPLNLSKIAFPLAHPAMLRRISFKWLESFHEVTNDIFEATYGTAFVEWYSKIMAKGEHLMPNEIGNVDLYVKRITNRSQT